MLRPVVRGGLARLRPPRKRKPCEGQTNLRKVFFRSLLRRSLRSAVNLLPPQTFAALRSASTISVRSHEKFGRLRPKCPKRAVSR